MTTSILYEQPLNERTRIFLRLEHYFVHISHFMTGTAAQDTHAAVSALIEILTILDRNDVRSELLKELERHVFGLSKLLDAPNVDSNRLNSTLDKLTNSVQKIQRSPGKLVFELKENELLNSIRQRTAISAGTCGFDLPAFHHLLNQTAAVRSEHLTQWLSEFNPLKEGINLILSMIRSSAELETQCSENGFYQKSLDTQIPCQLIRINMPVDCGIYPEISGSKHRINVRFLAFTELGRPKQISHPLEFELSCCAI